MQQEKPAGIIDLTGGDGHLIRYAIANELPIIAFALTSDHASELRKHVRKTIFDDMKTEGSDTYEPKLAELLQTIGESVDPEKDPEEKKGGKKPKKPSHTNDRQRDPN